MLVGVLDLRINTKNNDVGINLTANYATIMITCILISIDTSTRT